MHKFHFYFFSFFIFSLLLFSCGGGSGGTPQPSDLSSSPAENSFVFYLENKLHLIGKFQVMSSDGQKNIYETSLPVQWAPRDPDRPDLGKEPQVFPKEGFTLSNLAKGEYLFRVVVSHQGAEGETVIGFIETRQSVVGGKNSPLDFSKSNWVYPDDDGDGFSNIAELTDGFYNEEPTSPSRFFWSSWEFIQDSNKKSDPKDSKKHPTGSYLITPEKIHPTSPDDSKNSKLIGEILSVQAGTDFTVIHFSADGITVKEKIHFFSKIDGSFEAVLKNSEEEDKLILVATSEMRGDQLPDQKSILQLGDDSLPEAETTLVGKWMKITYRPLKMIRCRTVKGIDPIAGSGYVLLEGEGISPNASENEVRFPRLGGGEVAGAEVSIAWEGSKSREIKVRIPSSAVSGYPTVYVNSSHPTSGQCPTNQPVVALQNRLGELPDLYIPRVDAPYVALLGRAISIDIPILNQGLSGIDSSSFPYFTYLSKGGVDRKIYPNSTYLDQPRTDGTKVIDPEEINGKLAKGGIVFPSQNRYILAPKVSDLSFIDSLVFKAKVGPLAGSEAEQDTMNNEQTADHSTFIHSFDLQFLLDGNKINFGGAPLFLETGSDFMKPSDETPRSLTFPLRILLGAIKNNGTFPLLRDRTSQPVSYHSGNRADPLDTALPEGEYQKKLKLLSKKEYAEADLDVGKSAALELIEQANLLNQKTELPVLIHLYRSQDGVFDPNVDVPIECADRQRNPFCEFCVNRLQRGESVGRGKEGTPDPNATTIDLEIPLDQSGISPGDRYLFIVAEAIQIDPRKVNRDQGVHYCEATSDERKKMHRKAPGKKEGQAIPLLDYKPGDNLIRIRINP